MDIVDPSKKRSKYWVISCSGVLGWMMKQVLVNALSGVRRVVWEMSLADYALVAVLIVVGILAAVTVVGPA